MTDKISYNEMMDNMQNYSSKKEGSGLSVDQLMQPRYMVIADYPNSVFNIGEVLSIPILDYSKGTVVRSQDDRYGVEISVADKYPHIFRPMAWHEGRKVEEMPEYVKYRDMVIKPSEWFIIGSDMRFHIEEPFFTDSANNCYPATEQQYLDYINKAK